MTDTPAMPELKLHEVIWLPVVGYENFYDVSENGEIRNKSGKILSCTPNSRGYRMVHLSAHGREKTLRVHVIVAQSFIGLSPSESHVVNHKDRNKTNNHFGNLEWVSKREDCSHAKTENMAGTHFRKDGRKRPWEASLMIGKQRVRLGYHETQEQAHKAYIDELEKRGLENKYATK